MADWAVWMLLAGALVAAELFSGTFYLLMLAIGMVAGSLVSYAGLALEWQFLIAAVVGIVATGLLRRSRFGLRRSVVAARDPNVSMDIGQTIHVDGWFGENGAYSARVPYRGALWDVDLEGRNLEASDLAARDAASNEIAAGPPPVGLYIIREMRGSRLIVAAVANPGQAVAPASHPASTL